jgi:hypothetical protein
LTVSGFAFIIIVMKGFHFLCQIRSKGFFPIKTGRRAGTRSLNQVLPEMTFIVDPIDKLSLLLGFNASKSGIIGTGEALNLA